MSAHKFMSASAFMSRGSGSRASGSARRGQDEEPQVRALRRALIHWYELHGRTLPWREHPDPYRVWVSEVMLQQTRVEVVKAYFARWMKALPDIFALASASDDQVLSLWQGLGYYSRARRLRQGAQFVVEQMGGRLPSAPQELLKVPGIGPYSAGAISSIAYGLPSAIVDGNVVRVLTRLFALAGDPTRAPLKAQLWALSGALVCPEQPGNFNQALMELGALVCTPSSPLCIECPLRSQCRAQASGQASEFPQLPRRPPPTQLEMVLVFLQNADGFLVQRLDESARWWAGLDAFPFAQVAAEQSPLLVAQTLARRYAKRPHLCPIEPPVIRHTVTRFAIQLHSFLAKPAGMRHSSPGLRIVPAGNLGKLALPAPHKKAWGNLLKWQHDQQS